MSRKVLVQLQFYALLCSRLCAGLLDTFLWSSMGGGWLRLRHVFPGTCHATTWVCPNMMTPCFHSFAF